MAIRRPLPRRHLAASWALLWFTVRRLRSEPLLPLLVVLVVAVSAGILAAAPRVANRAADEEIAAVLRAAPPLQRNVQVSAVDVIGGEPDLDQRVAQVQRLFASPLRRVIERRDWAVLSTRFGSSPPTAGAYRDKPVTVVLTDRSGIADQVDVVDGALPGAEGCDCRFDPGDPEPKPMPIRIAISDATATFLGWHLNDVVSLEVDLRDPLAFGGFGGPAPPVPATIVGIFRIRQPAAEYWFGDARLANVIETRPDAGGEVIAAALVGSGGLADLANAFPAWSYQLNYTVDGSHLDAEQAAAVAEAARRATTDPQITQMGGGFIGVSVRTSLPQILGRAAAAFAQTQAVLLIALLGIGSVAATALTLLAVLLVARRREAAAVIRGRGASRTELVLPQLLEAGALALLGGGLGWIAAERAVAARESAISALAGLAMAVVGAGAVTVAALLQARRSQQALEREVRPISRLTPRRLVAEGFVVAAAGLGVYLVRQRGFRVTSAGPDPFLAVAPALAGLAVALLVLRIYPLPVALAARLAARLRGLVLGLGLGRAARRPDAARLPLVAVLLAAAMASFAGVVTASMDQAEQAAAWRQLGADIRVVASSGANLSAVHLAALPGVTGVAEASVTLSVPFSMVGQGGGSVRLIGIDGAAFERVTGGTPAATTFPAGFAGSTADGSQEHPIPAITSLQIPGSRNQFAVGAAFTLAFNATGVNFRVAEVTTEIPGLVADGVWVVVPASALEARFGTAAPPPSVAFVRGAGSADSVRRAVLAVDPAAVVETRSEALGSLSRTPLAGAVTGGFGLASLIAAAFAAVCVVLGLALSAPERARDTARLRTMGLGTLQALGMATVEQVPPVVIALLTGGGFGIGLAWLVLPGVDLAAFTGGDRAVPLIVDLGRTATLLAVVLATVLLGVVLAALADGRRQLARALRVGDE